MILEVSIKKKLHDFNLEIDFCHREKVLAIFGKSGSGKTSILNILAGIDNNFSGHIKLNEEIVFSSKDKICKSTEKRKIGYVFQDLLLFPNMNVKDNLLYGYKDKNFISFEKTVEILELENIIDRKIQKISGGEKQRVALGRALLSSPKLLLLDEPLSNLDKLIKNKIIFYLNRIKNELSLPIIYVTHYPEEVLMLSDELLIIDKGKIIDKGLPIKLLQKDTFFSTSSLDNIENIFNLEVIDNSFVYIGNQKISLPNSVNSNKSICINISANEIILAIYKPEKISARNILKGKIVNIFNFNEKCIIELNVGLNKTLFSEITFCAQNELNFKIDQEIFAIFKSNSIKIINI